MDGRRVIVKFDKGYAFADLVILQFSLCSKKRSEHLEGLQGLDLYDVANKFSFFQCLHEIPQYFKANIPWHPSAHKSTLLADTSFFVKVTHT